jgi:hypothetical protein
LIFPKVMTLGLRKVSWIISFPDFFSLCLQIFIWCLVHCFTIPRYRSSSNLFLIHLNFTNLWPMDLEKYYELSVLCTFVAPPLPPTGFVVSDSYKSKFSFVLLELFWLNIPPVRDLVLLAIFSECLLLNGNG